MPYGEHWIIMPVKCCARQEKGESVASWGSRRDEMQTDLREAVRRVCKAEETMGAIGLINHLGNFFFTGPS